MKYIKFFSWLFLAIIALTFASFNYEVIEIDLFPFPYIVEIPKFILLFSGLFVGAILFWFVDIFQIVGRLLEERKSKIEINKLKKEIEQLRSTNIKQQKLIN